MVNATFELQTKKLSSKYKCLYLLCLLQSHISCCFDVLCPTQNHKGDTLGLWQIGPTCVPQTNFKIGIML